MLKQQGERAKVILDLLTESNIKKDVDYFDRNILSVKKFLLNDIKNIEKLPNQKFTTIGKK